MQRHSVLALAAVVGLGTSAKTGGRQCDPRAYRLTDLGPTGFLPNPDLYGTVGINNHGEVVYGFQIEGQVHAGVWLPKAAYGLAQGFHDISDVSSAPLPAIARDINDAGIVVGQAGSVLDSNGTAYAWDLTAVDFGPLSLGTFPSGSWSGAHAVNNASPPEIVGIADLLADCECPAPDPPQNNNLVDRGFRLALDGSPTVVSLQPAGTDSQCRAHDVQTVTSGDPLIVGQSHCYGGLCAAAADCSTTADAVAWATSVPTVQPDLSANGSDTRASPLRKCGVDSPCTKVTRNEQ